jgi:iron complex outermembrane receptor protein
MRITTRILGSLLGSATIGLPAMAAAGVPRVDDATPDDIVVIGGKGDAPPVAAKADIPLRETPQAISIVSQEMLRDRGLLRLGDALSGVAGVSRNNVYGFFDGFNIRGFNASSGATYLDGLLEDAALGTSEMTGLEQVEVVKGPASGLFGQGPLSGIVNLVSKRPQDTPFVDMAASVGAYALRELDIDANGPLTANGRLTARLAGVYRDQDFFVDGSGQKRLLLSPALGWKIGPATRLTLLGRYQRDTIRPWSPTTAYGTALPNPNGPLPRSLAINDIVYPAVQKNDYWSLGYVFDQKFGDALTLSQSLRYQDFHNSWDNWLFITGINRQDIPATATTPRIPAYSRVSRAFYGPYVQDGTYFRVDTHAGLRFDTGALNHYVLTGIDYGHRQSSEINLYDTSKPYELDLYAPVYGTVRGHNPALPVRRSGSRTCQAGLYLQDHVKLGARLAVTVGGRWDDASAVNRDSGVDAPRTTAKAFSPHVGATFALDDRAALYANYSKSFSPQFSYRDVDQHVLPPERGVNYEGGLKFARGDGRLTGMVTIFTLTRANVATADAVLPNVYVVTGAQRTRGVEAEAAWRPLPGVDLTGAYSFLDAKVTADNRLRVGSRLGSVPRHIVDLWARYTIQHGPLANLGAGAGLHHEGARAASTASSVAGAMPPFRLGAYSLVEGAIFYRFDDWSVQANVRNLFDQRYFPTASLTRTTPGEPRTYRLSLRRSF